MKKLFALFALIPLGANATIIYNNGGPLDGGTTVASDLDMLFDPLPAGSADFCDDVNAPCFQEAADDFVLSAATQITGINWWGVYTNDNQFNAVADDFTLRILDAAFGLVADINVGSVTRFDTGLDALDLRTVRDIFAYEVNIAPLVLTAGQYYLSVVNNTAGDGLGQRWSWQSTAGISGTEAQARQSNVVFADTTTGWDDVGAPPEFPGFDLAFNLTSVPEPSTIALLGIGILGLGLARRRKKCAS